MECIKKATIEKVAHVCLFWGFVRSVIRRLTMEFAQLFDMPYLIFSLLIFAGTLIFVIQVCLSFIGVGIDTEGTGLCDLGASDFSFKFFSLMSIASFSMVGGTAGLYTITRFDEPGAVAIILALAVTCVAGLGMAYIVHKLRATILKLQSEGTVDIANAVGKTAKVYLSIKPNQMGKVEVDVQGRRKYIDAVAEDSSAEFLTGSLVKIVSSRDGNLLVVAKQE